MAKIHCGISLMPEDEFRVATAPLFEAGIIDALEWSFDMGWHRPVPAWVQDVVSEFEKQNRLYGHGVEFSAFSMQEDREWISKFSEETWLHTYRLVSEHYGFMRCGAFDGGAPLPVPFADAIISNAQR